MQALGFTNASKVLLPPDMHHTQLLPGWGPDPRDPVDQPPPCRGFWCALFVSVLYMWVASAPPPVRAEKPCSRECISKKNRLSGMF